MTTLKIGNLKKLIEHIPDDYDVSYKTETSTKLLSNTVEIDLDNKELILN
ncbi:MAG: hypothetical protein IJF83_03400 [Methanobrevibacter sp.]|nr:hypothetical protein [Methanobrevibacter sp.]